MGSVTHVSDGAHLEAKDRLVLRAPCRTIPAASRLLAAGLLAAGLLAAGLSLLAGCGTPPELREPPGALPTAPPTTAPATPTPGFPTAGATALPGQETPAFGELTAVACQGRPSGTQVVALLRRSPDVLPAQARVTVTAGPVCAGDWQYTVVQVPQREPLQVVSKGRPTALTLVTAGTDVCNIPVRTQAPPGIQTYACTEAPPPTAGA
jgi:hypothetical protein